MISPKDAQTIACAFEGTTTKPHFKRIAFVINNRIFATLSYEEQTLNLMFDPPTQLSFCPPDSEMIYPVPNAWGTKGATTINLQKAPGKLVQAALKEAYLLKKNK